MHFTNHPDCLLTPSPIQASRFNLYEHFCSGHPEALEVVRKIQQQSPIEWDAFEQHAAYLASHPFDSLYGEQAVPQKATKPSNSLSSQSYASHEERMRCLTLHNTLTMKPRRAISLDTPHHGVKEKESNLLRLSLTDYLIKPVQRICKYPLLLSQLKTTRRIGPANRGRSGRGSLQLDVNVIVESAMQAMRLVVSAVDEARHRQDIYTQSSLIVSRISLTLASPLPAPTTASDAPSSPLTSTFLTSLGACVLVGSLDVMHYPATSTTIKAKYLGAFLYMGGYFVLVKVRKGKVYEPRHWFSLIGFELTDVADEEGTSCVFLHGFHFSLHATVVAMLPCSFRLSCNSHRFELAAACRREKETWMSSLRESVKSPPPWISEPASSLHLDGNSEPTSLALENKLNDPNDAFPTGQSISELGFSHNREEPLSCTFQSGPNAKPPPLRLDVTTRSDSPSYHVAPSRRSSTASVKAIFSPLTADPNTIVIRRSSPSARLQVDHGLQDIISQPCIAARWHASMHEEELFQAPKITRSSFSRSSSGLSMVGAMGTVTKNRLSRHESLRVPRRRSTVHAYGSSGELDASAIEPRKRIITVEPLASKRCVNATAVSKSAGDDEKTNVPSSHWDVLSDTSTPLSPCSSRSMSAPNSTLVSPTQEVGPSSSSAVRRYTNGQADHILLGESDHLPKRTRSMVDSVRRLFHSRRRSLDNSIVDAPINDPYLLGPLSSSTLNPGLLKRWSIGSLHRRVRSTPNVPKIEQTFTATRAQLPNPDSGIGMDLSDDIPSPSEKRRSLGVTAPHRRCTPDESHTSPGGLQRSLSFLQCLKVGDIE